MAIQSGGSIDSILGVVYVEKIKELAVVNKNHFAISSIHSGILIIAYMVALCSGDFLGGIWI
jgi:hypothetical protein